MSHESVHREPVSPVDTAWLRMDTPTNLMMITGVMVFDEPFAFEQLEALLRERLLKQRRFRQRVVESRLPLVVPHWEDDPHFDLRAHIHRVALPSPGDQAALQEMVSDLMSTPLDRSKPLWQLHLVEGYGKGCAIVTRIHHCMGDGVALVRVLLELTDEGTGVSLQAVGVPATHFIKTPVDMARHAAEQAATLGKLLILPSDPKTSLRGPLGTSKRAAWSGPVNLGRVKWIAKGLGAKVNDVLVGALVGALRSYLEDHGGLPGGAEIRAMVPVYMQGHSGGEASHGNHFGLVFLPLPLGITEPLACIAAVKERMDAIKGSAEATVALNVLGAMGVASTELEHVGLDIFTRKATVMVTNVPGPPATLHMAEHALRQVLVWAPVSGALGLSVSMLSYAGEVRVGVASDAGLVANPEVIVQAFEKSLAQVEAAATLALSTARTA